MIGSRVQGGVLLLAAVALSLFLLGHSLLVEVDHHACFENFATAIHGQHPYLRPAEMAPGVLARAALRRFSGDDLIVLASGLLPLLPFGIAWRLSRTSKTRLFWLVFTLAAVLVIVTGVSMSSLADFHDCDRKGVDLGIVVAPLAYMLVNLAAMSILVTLRYPFTL